MFKKLLQVNRALTHDPVFLMCFRRELGKNKTTKHGKTFPNLPVLMSQATTARTLDKIIGRGDNPNSVSVCFRVQAALNTDDNKASNGAVERLGKVEQTVRPKVFVVPETSPALVEGRLVENNHVWAGNKRAGIHIPHKGFNG
ncbi:hypothetical protein V5O48_010151 [Marasmius crinis-equi]|uniref:Uncharacterized protein n=1 Tax=Marasmius crinis-equi TaxID=585013 RepID=A0ABR3F9B3_9AGAR